VSLEVLPDTVARRRKLGFEVPIDLWLRGSLRPALGDWLAAGRLDSQGVLNSGDVSRLVDEHLSGHHDHGRPLWTLMVLSRWLETSGVA
jgi:asparagine synthase (glutamine-hydrolysing)